MGLNEELLEAVRAGVEDQNRVLELIRQGANVQCKDSKDIFKTGNTPLFWAVRKGHLNICKTLLENGADANTCHHYNFRLFSPLTRAIHRGNEKIVRLLLENGVDPNFKPKTGGTALDEALNTKNTENCIRMITLLLEHGADVNNVAGKEKPLHWACENRRKDLVELLLYKGANIDALDFNKEKPVDIAKEKGYTEVVDLFEKDWLGLYHASQRGNYDECKALLEQGALVDSSQFSLYCPIAAACEAGHLGIVQLLLGKKQIANNKDDYARNPLHLATKNGHKDIVSLLLKNGASRNVKVKGDTLLHVATRKNHSDLLQLLMQRKLNPNIKNHDGFTALHYAVSNGNEDMVSYLIQHGAKVNIFSNKMETPLHLACEAVHQEVVSILLKNKANTEVLNGKNEKPKDIIDRKRTEMEQPTEEKLKIMNNMKEEIIQYSLGNLESNQNGSTANPDSSSDEDDYSDSDATVDWSPTTNESIKAKFSNRILDPKKIVDFTTKMTQLSHLIVEFNEKAVKLEVLQADLSLETDTLKSLNRKIKKTLLRARLLKVLKGEDSEAQIGHEDAIKKLTRKVEGSGKKQAELKEEVKTLQTEIQLLKATVKGLYVEIAHFIP